ncbi:MAG: twin-arginine translocation signal domain-containing protein, partial [Akkermansiaceae bacterium]|nr:twin-arginine translocation signal domain-containing protein [Verrucomicrobiales bacterium]
MENKNVSVLTRRQFLRQAACAAVGTAALTSAIRDLRFMNAAVAQSNVSDYKAMVCIFMAGGNDSNNLIIPTIQSEYDNYAAIRS